MSGKNLGQILIQLRSNQYCATISFENENYLHEGKTKRREDSSFQSFDDRDSEWEWKDKSLEQKDFSTRKMDVFAKDEIELNTDFHIHIENICLRYIDSTTLIFFNNNDNLLNYIFIKCTCNFQHTTLESMNDAKEFFSSLPT